MRRVLPWAVGVLLAAGLNFGPGPASAVPEHGRLVASPGSAGTVEMSERAAARLTIPAIGVSAGMIPVGVTASGELAVGGSVTSVYRWRQGAYPGDPGSAVLAGHTWSRGDGVFDRLGELRKGARISVGRTHFRVTRVRKVRGLSQREVRGLYSDMGKPRLVLITCGDRNNATGVYTSRILVYADKVRR